MPKFTSAVYCTTLLLLFVILYFVAASLIRYRRAEKMRLIILYGLTRLAEYTISFFGSFSGYVHPLQNVSSNIAVLAELVLLCLFVKCQLRSDSGNRMMLFFLQFFPLAVCYYWLYSDSIGNVPTYLTVAASFIIIISCLGYFYEILTDPPDVSLIHHPPFLVISGMLLVSVLAIPLSLYMDGTFSRYNSIYSSLYSIKCLSYIILFTFFIIALKCQTKLSYSSSSQL